MDKDQAVIIQPFTMDFYQEVFDFWKDMPGMGLSDADSRENIEKFLKRNPGCSFLALLQGRVVGTVLAGHDGRRGYIHHMAVSPGYRRQGIAGKLLESSLDLLRKAGIQKAHLFIYKDNSLGLSFWRILGWKLREDLHMMSLDLV